MVRLPTHPDFALSGCSGTRGDSPSGRSRSGRIGCNHDDLSVVPTANCMLVCAATRWASREGASPRAGSVPRSPSDCTRTRLSPTPRHRPAAPQQWHPCTISLAASSTAAPGAKGAKLAANRSALRQLTLPDPIENTEKAVCLVLI